MSRQTLSQNKVLKFAVFLAILAVCWYCGRVFKVNVTYYQNLLSGYPVVLSGLAFVALYVGTTTFVWLGPKDVLRIASAILFGATVSTVFVWIGEMFNAAIMFHLSRVLGRDYVQQKLGKSSQKLDQIKDETTSLGVIAWRINPLVPFRIMDLGFGLSRISFRKYVKAIIAVTFFRIYWLQFILAGIGEIMLEDLSSVIEHLQTNTAAVKISAVYFLAVVAVTAVSLLARMIRKRKRHHGTAQ